MKCGWIGPALVVWASAAALPALAADYSLSGFGTLGYARSNQPYTYQRFIDDGGTLKRDSVAGLQMDARFNENFGATVQVLAAPATNSDRRYDATVAWAFLSWRPSNDWLVRAGKQRLPLYLYSQTYNVGVTYDFARLPEFHRAVLRATLGVKSGHTATYGAIAAALGQPPGASCAVGTALGANPWPLLIPCHRIVAAGGKMTGFSGPGGVATKVKLLALEGARLL